MTEMPKRYFILTLLLLLLAGCQTGPDKNTAPRKPNPLALPDSISREEADLLVELDGLFKQWRDATNSGLTAEQARLANEIKTRVNQHFDFLTRATQLNDSNGVEVKEIATGVLGFSGQKTALPFLMAVLTDTSELIRGNALVGIALIGDKETPVTPLINVLSDESAQVRGAAAFALLHVLSPGQPRGATAPLIKLLDDKEWNVRNEAIRALAICGDTAAVEPLISKGLTDENELIVINTVFTLGVLKDNRAVAPLIKLLERNSPRINEAVSSTLSYLTGHTAQTPKEWQDWWAKNKAGYESPSR